MRNLRARNVVVISPPGRPMVPVHGVTRRAAEFSGIGGVRRRVRTHHGDGALRCSRRGEGHGTAHLSVRSIEALPEVVRGERSALVIATTDQGNLAKLLVSSGLRRQAEGGRKAAMVPVINLDRFETVDSGIASPGKPAVGTSCSSTASSSTWTAARSYRPASAATSVTRPGARVDPS